MIDLPPLPKLWLPPKPAIVRAASLKDIAPNLAMSLLSAAGAASVRGGGWGGAAARGTIIQRIQALGLTDGLVLCLDAGDINSWPGSGQTWLDVSGNGYDFFRGASGSSEGSDPTFSGTPGGNSVNEYWSFDGGDYFTYDSANETWMNNLHKAGSSFTVLTWVYAVDFAPLYSGFIGTNAGNNVNIRGINFGLHKSGTVKRTVTIGADTTGWHQVSVDATNASLTQPVMHGASVTVDAADTTFVENGTEIIQANSFVGSAATGNASYTTQIGALGNAGYKMASGSRMYSIAVWTRALSGAERQAFYAATRSIYGV